ncbi:MAG: ABC transporter permease [Candidatus Acidiferrales bacterium]
MSLLRSIASGLRSLVRKERVDRELDEELHGFLEMATEEKIKQGMSRKEAIRAVRLERGSLDVTKEVVRDAAWESLIETSWQDLRFGARMLRKNPGFAAVVVMTLALGIGVNTAIFNVIQTVVLQPLPFADPDQLVWLNGKMPQTDDAGVSPADFLDYRDGNRSFEQIAGISQVVMAGPSNLSGDKPEQVMTSVVSAGFFHTLGVPVLLGRDFQNRDEQINRPQVVILGNGIWKRDFAGDRNMIGHNIRLDGQSMTVVGVLSTDIPLISQAQIWLPTPRLNFLMRLRGGHFLKVIGRLKRGVTLPQAQGDLDAIAQQLAEKYPDTDQGWSLRQRSLREVLIGPARPLLLVIWAAAGLLLLIACTNLANLFLTRSVGRQREFALRTALGATRTRITRQALAETMMIVLVGGALGALAASWGVSLLRVFGPPDLPRLQEVHVNLQVVTFAFGITLLTGVIFGLIPALQIGKGGFSGLKESARHSEPAAHRRIRNSLVVAEIAVSLMLLVGAGLLIRSFWLLIHVDPGFQTQRVLTAQLSLNGPSYNDPAYRVRFWQDLEERVATLPGVEAVGATSELPLTGQHSDGPFKIPGHRYGPSEFDDAYYRQVTPGYLAAMRIPLLAGRWLDQNDTAKSPGTLLVNQAFAKRFFPGQDVLGKHLELLGDAQPDREIVGIVGNISHRALSDPQEPEMYVAYAQYAPPTMNLVVRAVADRSTLAAALDEPVRAIDKDETLSAIRPLDDIVASSVSQPRFLSLLLSLFAGLAVTLAAIGIYGVMAYSVSQRTNEIGIRMALGAKQSDVLKMVVWQGMKLAAAGALIGIAGSLLFGHFLESMLYGVRPRDPLTFVLVSIGLFGVSLVANYIPAQRAMRVDPMVALRYE